MNLLAEWRRQCYEAAATGVHYDPLTKRLLHLTDEQRRLAEDIAEVEEDRGGEA